MFPAKYISFFLICGALLLPSCKVKYSMTGASISPDVKTFTIKYFPKTAPLGPATLSQVFTESLREKFLSQTSLAPVETDGDLFFEGAIVGYSTQPLAIQPDETAAQNRLTISVTVKYINRKDEKQNFESTFSRYADYSSSQNLTSIEDELIRQINVQLVDDIFNKAVINW
jgi:hypothetical protein